MLIHGNTSNIDTSISQNTKNVKSDTSINNYDMQNNENNTNIQDFGEKIGGARKDLAQPKSVIKTTKEVSHDYTVTNTENGYSVNFKNKILKDGFKIQSEAEQYILDFKNSVKDNRAFVKESNGMLMTGDNKYLIYLRNPRTLKSQYIGKGFTNKQDAENYAMALSIYLKENGKNLFRPQIQKVDRVNANNKNATNATGKDILDNFGFKGGEFGNWVTQNERQQFLNYAQDAFTDLAIALDITQESLGQNRVMSIAFGARGQGLTGAVAHFEPDAKVINMTRLKGAGSLAHEYGHSIDNYLSRYGGYDENGMATTNMRNPKLSDNMRTAINNVVDAIKYNVSTNQEEIDKKNAIYEKGRKSSLETHLSYLDNVFSGNQTTYKYNRKTKQREQTKIQVTEGQKQKYQDIRKILINGKLDSKRTFVGKSLSSNEFEYAKPIEDLKTLYKEVVGRKINDDTIYWLYRYGQPSKQLTQIKSESAYVKSSRELDKATGRATAYFSKIEEMWARAFEAYVSDKLKGKGITNTYLVHSVNNSEYALFNPFPAGEERKNINKAFDNLIQVMKDEGLFTSSEMLQNFDKDTGIRYMKKANAKTTTIQKVVDNLGRKLSKQQQEYFKDSKVRDEDGNLLTVFHGSNSEFTIFDLSKSGQASKESKIGFWFTETKEGAENFANSLWYGDNKAKSYETYLNIRKPKVYNSINNSIELENIDNRIRELKNIIRKLENKNIAIEINKGELRWANENELADIAKYKGIDLEDAKRYHHAVNEYNKLEKDYDNKKYNDSYEKFRSDIYAVAGKSASDANFGGTGMWLENENEIISKFKQKLIDEGYDGIIIRNTKYDSDTMGRNNNQYVAFYPEQIKNVDNTNPTDNPDIRYLKKKKNNSNILENYDELTSNRIKMNTRNVVIENSNQLNNLIDEALTTNKNKALHLGKLNAEIVSKIKNNIQNLPQSKLNLLNKDTYDLVINQSEIRHLIDDKSTLSNNDIKHFIKVLPEIIANSDYVSYTNNLKDEGLRFKKLMEDGTYVSFVIVSNKQGTMKVKTIYMEKGDYENKKRSISPSNNANEIALDNTSETNGAFASTTSIAQNPENVNTSKKTSKVEDGLTNSERADAYIEQEIKKVEATGKWDNSIPVTRRTDIRKTIEDYLGIGIQKGHFRQRAYGIYNTKTDSIRTKELKDMDSILHEVGHALDLGNRLEIDKESIADELLKAINKYGGYEGNPRSVLLDEGWAEVIREYAIIPEQAKAEYPQSVAVLEELRKADKDFDNFIGKVQEQIYNYIHQNPQNRVLSNMSIGEQTDKKEITPKTIKENIVKLVWDKDYALKATVEEFAKANGRAPTPSENAYLLARLASGVQTKAISMISDGYINEKGETMIPGLSKLGDILGNNPERFNDLRSFLVAQRDLDYKAKTLKTGIRTMDSQAVIKQFEKDTQIQRAAKIVHNTLDGVLTYAVDNGLITRVDADQIRQSNAFYVPMQRVLENRNNQVGRRGAVSDIIKSRTGSELDIKDVLENIVVNSTNIIQQVENNSVLRALYKQGDEAGMKNNVFEKIPAPMQKVGTAQLSTWEKELQKQGIDTNKIDFEKTIDIFAPNNKIDTKNRITSFIDEKGNRVYLQFSDEVLFNTIMNLDKNTNSMFLKIMRNMNMPLKYGATMANVGFALPNMISDTVQAAIFSEAGFIPVVDNALGVLDILTASNKTVANFMKQVAPEYANRINRMYTLYEQSGASSSTRLSQYRKSSQELMRDVYGTKNSETLGIKESFKPLKRLLDIMTYIPEISEQSTRFKVFEKNYEAYRKKGGTELDARIKAAIESRDATQDFGRTGTLMKEVNQLIPFSAARVGSAYTFVEKVKANPKRTVARIAVLTAVAMAIKAIGYDDKEIEELNQRKKDDNFVFKIGDSIITIKKPQGILRSIVNLAEYIQDLATGHIEEGKEGERLGEWINNAIMDNMPADSITGLVPNAFAPLIENAINKDFYYNTDIVKSYDLDLPDSEQYYDYNSQLAILLGQIFNYSPAKIDNLISGYFGGLGTQVTDTIDWISGKLGLSAEEPAMGAEENAIGKRFVVNVNTNSASIDEIYDRKTELTKKKNGGTITDEETEELEKITEAISNISSLNKQIKEIKQSLTISAEQKAVQIKDLQKQKTDTARQALGKDLIYSDTADKIESTKFYPSRDTLSSNGYSLTLTSSMKKEYEKLAYEKYKQYEKQGLYSEEYLEKLETQAKDYAKQTLIKKYKSKLVKTK